MKYSLTFEEVESKNTDPLSSVGALVGFLPAEEFRKKLRIEKCRVERSGIPLSLALFFLKDELTQDSKIQHRFFVSIKKRIRETDIIGWVNSEAIGLILFNTGGQGAERCVELLTTYWQHRYCDTLTRSYPDSLFNEILERPL